MTSIQSLPYELLIKIFGRLDTPSQAAECSLVCKAWNDPAIRAMLGYTIIIDSNETIYNLVRIFAKDPTKAKFIKHIEFGLPGYDYQWLHVFLLHALNRNLESLTGQLHTSCLAMLLHCVSSVPSGTLCNMKTLAITDKTLHSATQTLRALSLCLCDTLETLQPAFIDKQDWNFVYTLPRFVRLKHIYFDGFLKELKNLNAILDNGQQLEHLTLMELWSWDDKTDPMENYAAMVGRKHNLKAFTIGVCPCDCYATLLKYLVNKCPGLTNITINYPFQHKGDLSSIQNIVRNVPHVDFRVQYSLFGRVDAPSRREEALAFVNEYFDRAVDISIGKDRFWRIDHVN